MSLSTALIPQQRQPCNLPIRTARIFARILEQRHGNWSCMSSRSICRNSTITLPAGQGSVQCAGKSLGTCHAPNNPRVSSFVAQQQQQLRLQLAQQREDREDYRIYPQSVDLNAFFGEEQKCEKVSDVCLLNDHFILVKMPEQQEVAKRDHFGSKLPRCFQCNRGSRVSPILEELEEPQPAPRAPSDQVDDDDDDADVEVFTSSTRIISSHNRRHQLQANPVPASKPQPVIVEQPQPDNSLQLKLEALLTSPVAPVSPAAPQPAGSFDPWYWFLWPFRRRQAAGKSRAHMAAVHKTYFVRWNKPPNTLWHGYGVERDAQRVHPVELRRCRSAIF